MMQEKKKMSLIAKIGVGFVIGLVLGFIIGPMATGSPFIADIVIPVLQLIGASSSRCSRCSSYRWYSPA